MIIRDKKLFSEDYENFAAFLWEARLSEGNASKLISVFQKFVQEYGLKQEQLATIGYSSLYTLIPLATSKEKALELVENASAMRRDDVADMVRVAKHGECAHRDTHDLHLRVCNGCGLKTKVHE